MIGKTTDLENVINSELLPSVRNHQEELIRLTLLGRVHPDPTDHT